MSLSPALPIAAGAPADRRLGLALAALFAVTALVLALTASATMLWDRDEGFYARTAAEMLRSGHFLVPSYNGEVFADKPPLIYWLIAASMAIFGETEFAGRLPSVLAGAASAVVTGLIAARLIGRDAALLAAGLFATMAMSFYLGQAIMLDGLLTLFITLSILAFVDLLDPARRPYGPLALFAVAMAGGMLTKGPVAPAVVGGAVLVTLAFRTARPPFARLAGLALAGLASLAAFALWAVPADRASGGAIAELGFSVHILGRFLTPMQGHGGSGALGYLAFLPIYVPVILLGVLPWTGTVAGGLAGLLRGDSIDGKARAVLIGWIAPTFVLFTLAATKLPHYVFPLFPALAIAAAALIRAEPAAATRRVFVAGLAVQVFALLAGAVLVAAAALVRPDLVVAPAALVIALILAASTMVGLRLNLAGRQHLAAWLTIGMSALIWPALVWFVAAPAEPAFKMTRAAAAVIRAATPDDVPVFATVHVEPSFVFYLHRPADRRVERLPRDADQAMARLRAAPDFALLTTADSIGAIETALGAPLERLGSWTVIDLNHKARERTFIVARRAASTGGQQAEPAP